MKRLWLITAALPVLAALPLMLGCEVESSADTELNLNPRQVTLRAGQSAVFTVSGGYEYRWSLSDESLGALNKRTGNQVTYTATSTNAGTQTLTVLNYIEGASGNNPTNVISTNQVNEAASSSATIIQVGSTRTPVPATPPTVRIRAAAGPVAPPLLT